MLSLNICCASGCNKESKVKIHNNHGPVEQYLWNKLKTPRIDTTSKHIPYIFDYSVTQVQWSSVEETPAGPSPCLIMATSLLHQGEPHRRPDLWSQCGHHASATG